MKKTRLLSLMLVFIILLSACGACDEQQLIWQDLPTIQQTNKSLSVFCLGELKDSQMLQLALDRYRELYPEVEVELIKPDIGIGNYELENELYSQIAALVMAGEGPDVFIVDDTIMDVEKLVRQGVFADMEPYFLEDNFNWEPYNQAVMSGGVWNGKRFIVPLSYNFPLLFTSQTALEETNFSMESCKDFQGFLTETTRYMDDPSQTRQLFRWPLYITDIVGYSGLSIADYDTRTVDLSSPIFQKGIHWYKTVMERCPNEYHDTASDSALYGAAAVRDGNILWTPALAGALSGFYTHFAAIKTIDKAIMMPIRDLKGGIRAQIRYPVAVRANSENLQNAYNYIKILLSFEVQTSFGWAELSVMDTANDYLYEKISQGRNHHIQAGVNGFIGSTNELESIDWPTQEEYEQFVAFTHEISGTYYFPHLRWKGAMYDFVYKNADYGETLESAQRQLEIYISE